MNNPAGEKLSVVIERDLPYPPEKVPRRYGAHSRSRCCSRNGS